MKYDNAVTSGSISGTTQFGSSDERARAHNRVDKTHAQASGGDNGKSVMFKITIDPQGIYTLGVSEFTLSAVAWGIYLGSFSEGTEWMSPTGRVRIMDGKLKYTRNKALYKLPEIREGKGESTPTA